MHWQAVSCNNNSNSNNKVNIVAKQPRRCHRWMCCASCLSCLLDVWMLGQLYWLPSLVRQVHVHADRRRERDRDRERERGDERDQLGNSFRQAGRQSPDDQTILQPRYYWIYVSFCVFMYNLWFVFQRLSTQQVSLLTRSPLPIPRTSSPLMLPPLLCASLQSHIRRTIFPIIETSFRRFVSFRFNANLSVGQSNCLKSRDLLRSLWGLPLCIMSCPVVQPSTQLPV